MDFDEVLNHKKVIDRIIQPQTVILKNSNFKVNQKTKPAL